MPYGILFIFKYAVSSCCAAVAGHFLPGMPRRNSNWASVMNWVLVWNRTLAKRPIGGAYRTRRRGGEGGKHDAEDGQQVFHIFLSMNWVSCFIMRPANFRLIENGSLQSRRKKTRGRMAFLERRREPRPSHTIV